MGWCIRELRKVEPKYAVEHAAANIFLSIVLLFLPTGSGSKLWWMMVFVLLVSLAVQGFRVWRLQQRQEREREERLRQAMEAGDGG